MRDIAIALFFMGTLPMALVRPIIGLMLWILFSYMNPHRLTWGFAFGFPWVFIAAAVTLFSLILHPEERQKIPWKSITVLLLFFLLWTGVTSVTAVEGAAAQGKWVIFFKIQLMALATLMLVKDRQRFHWILWVIVLSFGFWALKSGLFTVMTGGSFHVLGPRGSFFGNNNDFALAMCMVLPLMRYLQLNATHKWVRRGLWLMMVTTVISVVGTYSRGGLLCLAAVLFMLTFKSRRRVGLLIVAAVLAPTILSFMPQKWSGRMHTISNYKHVASAQSRIRSWKFAANVAEARPLLGGGFRVWQSHHMWNIYGPPGSRQRAIHSIYFEVLGEHGFIGIGLFLALIFTGWRTLSRIRRLTRDSPDSRWMADLASMFQVSITGFLIGGAFLTKPYYDLFYQLLVMTVLLEVFVERAIRQGDAQSEQKLAPWKNRPRLAHSRASLSSSLAKHTGEN